MPTYEYTCNKCEITFEVFASLKEREAGLQPTCETCGSNDVRKAISAPNLGGGLSKGSASCSKSSCSGCGSKGTCK